MPRIPIALFNLQDVGLPEGRYDFEPLKAELIKLCLTDPAAWFWSVTSDFTTITCARRGRGKDAPQVTRAHDCGDVGRSWIRRRAA